MLFRAFRKLEQHVMQAPADTDNGLTAGTLQEQVQALAARVQALEDAAV